MKQIILVGESGSGKDTVAQWLSKVYNMNIILSYTTRIKRFGESNTYRFTSTDEYIRMKNEGSIFESTEFGDNYYWTVKSDFDHPNWIIIVDPIGVINLKREFPLAKVVYVKCDVKNRAERVVDFDRVKRDIGRFNSFPCDFVIDNNGDITDLTINIVKMMGYTYGNNTY